MSLTHCVRIIFHKMSGINLQEVHDFLIDVAKKAGNVITSARPTTTATGEKKNSVDLVTETDQATERLVSDLLQKTYPDFKYEALRLLYLYDCYFERYIFWGRGFESSLFWEHTL